jgi:hypothetical protein
VNRGRRIQPRCESESRTSSPCDPAAPADPSSVVIIRDLLYWGGGHIFRGRYRLAHSVKLSARSILDQHRNQQRNQRALPCDCFGTASVFIPGSHRMLSLSSPAACIARQQAAYVSCSRWATLSPGPPQGYGPLHHKSQGTFFYLCSPKPVTGSYCPPPSSPSNLGSRTPLMGLAPNQRAASAIVGSEAYGNSLHSTYIPSYLTMVCWVARASPGCGFPCR